MILRHFTPEQIKELAAVFGLILPSKVAELKVSDGYIGVDRFVWWRSETGPEFVSVRVHQHNIREYPQFYSIEKPVVAKVEYV